MEEEVDALLAVLRPENLQACRQPEYIISEADLSLGRGFEMLSGALGGAVNGFSEVGDADKGLGVASFMEKGRLRHTRRSLVRILWVD